MAKYSIFFKDLWPGHVPKNIMRKMLKLNASGNHFNNACQQQIRTAQHSTNMWTHRQTRAFNVKWCNNLANRTINDPLQHAMSLESLVDTQFKTVFKICLNGWRRFSLLLLQSSKLWMLNYKLTEESHNTQKKWYPVQVSIKWKTSAVTVIVKLETICADGKDQIKL